MKNLRKAAAVLCGLVFLASSIAKLVSIKSFELYVFSLGLASFDLSSLAARLLIILEGVTGLWFLSGWQLRWARWTAWAQLAFFSAFLVWRMAVGDSQSCHCFGEIVDMNPVQSLLKNVALALLVAAAAKELYPKPLSFSYLAILAVASTVALFVLSPPDWYYRRQSSDSQCVVPGKWAELLEAHPVPGRSLVCFFSTECEFCRDCARKLGAMLQRHAIDPAQVHIFFMQLSDSTEVEVGRFYQDYMGGQVYPFELLDPLSFIPITGGAMPVVALSLDGTLVQEFDYLTLSENDIATYFNTDTL